jgi:hypothetical protein
MGDNIDDLYCYKGKWSRFFGRETDTFGYKLFLAKRRSRQPPFDEGAADKIFKIQNILFEGGYSPKAHEIIKFFDGSQHLFIIKMDRVKGTSVRPHKQWVESFSLFCKKNKLYRTGGPSITKEAMKKKLGNCILSDEDKKVYMVDIDWRWNQGP